MNFTILIFFLLAVKVYMERLHGTFILATLTTHWRKNTHLLDKSCNTIYQLPQILPKQSDFVHFIYSTNILNWPLNLALLHGKKNALPCQSTDRAHWSTGIDECSKCKHATIRQQLTALWSNDIQASSDWQYSSPMMLGDPVGAAVTFQGGRATLYHNPAKM